MEIVLQPIRSRVCGQACIAMIAGMTLAESIALIGHKKGTKTKVVASTLRKIGFGCPDKLVTLRSGELPPLCIVKLSRPSKKGNWHWMVHDNGRFLDPSRGVLSSLHSVKIHYPGWSVTSYLPIERSEKECS